MPVSDFKFASTDDSLIPIVYDNTISGNLVDGSGIAVAAPAPINPTSSFQKMRIERRSNDTRGFRQGGIRIAIYFAPKGGTIYLRGFIQHATKWGAYVLKVEQLSSTLRLTLGSQKPLPNPAEIPSLFTGLSSSYSSGVLSANTPAYIEFTWQTTPGNRPFVKLEGKLSTTSDLGELPLVNFAAADFATFPAVLSSELPVGAWSIKPDTAYELDEPVFEDIQMHGGTVYLWRLRWLKLGTDDLTATTVQAETWEPPVLTPSLVHYEFWPLETVIKAEDWEPTTERLNWQNYAITDLRRW